jgi:hypothetical protein
LIQAYDASLEKSDGHVRGLNNVKNGYAIARNKMLQQKDNTEGKLRAMRVKRCNWGMLPGVKTSGGTLLIPASEN